MKHIRAICFDLDDTLWDLGPVLVQAERAVYQWFGANHPGITERFSLRDFRAERDAVAREYADRIHDLKHLRRVTFERLVTRAGFPAGIVPEACEVFQAARNQVEVHADVLPALEVLSESRDLLALTNGNADLDVIGIRHFFDDVFSAADLGAAKPDPLVFEAVCRKRNLAAAQVLHVGDDPDRDIVAAGRAGMETVWVNRRNRAWPDGKPVPDHEVADLTALVTLVL